MDTTILVEKIKLMIASFAKEGKIVTCVRLVKAYSDLEGSSFILAIACPWTINYDSCFEKTREVVSKMYEILDADDLVKIHSVNVFNNDLDLENYVKSGGEDWVQNYCSEFIDTNKLAEKAAFV